jgi:hypothetical protein
MLRAILLTMLAIFIFVGISSTIINEIPYNELSWSLIYPNKSLVNWEGNLTENIIRIIIVILIYVMVINCFVRLIFIGVKLLLGVLIEKRNKQC